MTAEIWRRTAVAPLQRSPMRSGEGRRQSNGEGSGGVDGGVRGMDEVDEVDGDGEWC